MAISARAGRHRHPDGQQTNDRILGGALAALNVRTFQTLVLEFLSFSGTLAMR